MSELKEKIEGILKAGDMFLNPPEDMSEFIDKGAIKQSRADQILAAFKAHIEKCPKLEDVEQITILEAQKPYKLGYKPSQKDMVIIGARAQRKLYMESLEI